MQYFCFLQLIVLETPILSPVINPLQPFVEPFTMNADPEKIARLSIRSFKHSRLPEFRREGRTDREMGQKLATLAGSRLTRTEWLGAMGGAASSVPDSRGGTSHYPGPQHWCAGTNGTNRPDQTGTTLGLARWCPAAAGLKP